MDGQKRLVIEKPFPSFRLSLSLSDPHPYSHTQYNRHTQPLFKLKLATAFCLSLSPDSSFTVSFSFFLSLSFWIFLFLFQSFCFFLNLSISLSVSISFFLFQSWLKHFHSVGCIEPSNLFLLCDKHKISCNYLSLSLINPLLSLSLLHTQTTIHTLSLSFDLFVIFLSYHESSRGDLFCYCTFLPFLAVVCYQLISIKKANR